MAPPTAIWPGVKAIDISSRDGAPSSVASPCALGGRGRVGRWRRRRGRVGLGRLGLWLLRPRCREGLGLWRPLRSRARTRGCLGLWRRTLRGALGRPCAFGRLRGLLVLVVHRQAPVCAPAAMAMASMIFEYPVQRQRLPAMASRMAGSVGSAADRGRPGRRPASPACRCRTGPRRPAGRPSAVATGSACRARCRPGPRRCARRARPPGRWAPGSCPRPRRRAAPCRRRTRPRRNPPWSPSARAPRAGRRAGAACPVRRPRTRPR